MDINRENRRESAMIFDGQNDSLLYYATRSLFAVTPGSKGKSAHYESAAARRHTPHRPPRAFIQYDGGAGILSCAAAAHLVARGAAEPYPDHTGCHTRDGGGP